MAAASVRLATTADAAAIARVHVASWLETYRGLMPDEILDRLSVDRRTAGWTRVLEARRSPVFVAERDGEIVGFSHAGAARDEDAPHPLELSEIYLLRSAQGHGVGTMLLEAAIGDAAACLWVAAGNAQAIAFYRRNGFEPDGRTQYDMVEEIRLVRAAQPPVAGRHGA